MTQSLRSLLLIALVSGSAFGQNAVAPGNPRRARADAAVGDAVQGMFIAQFQEQVQVSDDQFVRILPLLRQGIETMRTNANRSLTALTQLRQMLRRSAPEDQINAQIQEVDESNRQTKVAQEAFVSNIDPFLTTEQRARFRVFQTTFGERLRDLVLRARQINNQRQQQR